MILRVWVICVLLISNLGADDSANPFPHIPYPKILKGSLLDAEEEVMHLARAIYRSGLFRWRNLYQWKSDPDAPYEIILQHTHKQCPSGGYVEIYTFHSEWMATELLEKKSPSSNLHGPFQYRWVRPEETDQEQRYWIGDWGGFHFNEKRERHYWTKVNQNGGRFAVSIREFNWFTTSHMLLWVPDFDKQHYDQIIRNIDEDTIHEEEQLGDSVKLVRFGQLFMLLRVKKTGIIIAIGHDYLEIGTWCVFIPRGDGTVEQCVIEFREDHEKKGLDLFPEGAFKELCGLLGEAIGIPHGWQGRPDPFSILRANIKVILTNAATRPWVFMDPEKSYTDYCYNTPERLEEGLKNWSKKHPEYAKIYAQIKALYPKSEKDLTQYYERYLQVNAAEAHRYAKHTLAIVYGSHFEFRRKKEK